MVEGQMTHHKPSRIFLFIISLLFISLLPFISTNARETPHYTIIASEELPDLLIFLSPQYAQDTEITTAISTYIQTINNDLGWNSKIIPIQKAQNDYQQIDSIIETTYNIHPLKACIMVGEDLSTPLGGDADYLEQPSTLPWSTLGETSGYEQTEQGIICKPTTIDICISLLYPTHEQTYEHKKSSIISAFHKFSTQRDYKNTESIYVFESSELNTNSKTLYQQLNTLGSLLYTEDATDEEISTACQQPSTAFFVHGHSTPAGTDIDSQKNQGWFSADSLDRLQSPFFGADGCYVGGWWSNQKDNNQLDTSVDAEWYGSKIFTSTSLQVMALGLLSQNGLSSPVSFLENIFPELLNGKTLAEAMIGETSIGDTIIVGDPTFQYTL